MKRNMLPIEAGLRALSGMLLLSSPLLDLPTYPVNLLGIVLIATGVGSFCPLKALGRKLAPPRAGTPTRPASAHG